MLLYLSNVQLDTGYKLLLGWLPAAAALVLTVWDLWAWRWPGINKLTHRPRIDGLWKAELQPTAESHIPPDGNRGPIPAFVIISQSFWSIHVRQITIESSSRSRSYFWEARGDADVERLNFLYENDPRPEHQDRSHRHLGSCTFDTTNLKPNQISGFYFTDRYTKGSMSLQLVDRTKGYGSYQEAVAHTGSS